MENDKRKPLGATGKHRESGTPGTATEAEKFKKPDSAGRRVRPWHKVVSISTGTPRVGLLRIRINRWSTVSSRVLAGLVLVLVVSASAMFGSTLVSAVHQYVLAPFGGFILSIPQYLVTPLVAVGAAVVAFLALRQKQAADRKQEWWMRMQYGVDQMASGNELLLTVGIGMLQHLKEEHSQKKWFRARIADASDLKLFNKVAAPLLKLPEHADNIEATKEASEDDE